MVVKYKTNRKGAPLGLSVLLLFLIVLAYTGPSSSLANRDFQLLILFCCFLSLDFFFGMFILASDTGIYSNKFFLFRRGLAYDEIQEVWYYPTYVTGGRNRTLAIKGREFGADKIVKLGGNKFFSEETLADIVFLISKHAPNAQLDGASEELMRSGSGARLPI